MNSVGAKTTKNKSLLLFEGGFKRRGKFINKI